MDALLAVLSISVAALTITVVLLVRRVRRMQRRLERQSEAIILLASKHRDVELPAETESDRPLLRLIQGGLSGIAAMVALGTGAIGRRAPRLVATGSVLVAGGAVAAALVLPSAGTSQRSSAGGVAPTAAQSGLPGVPMPTAAPTGPSAVPSGTAGSPAASSSAPAVAEPVAYVSTANPAGIPFPAEPSPMEPSRTIPRRPTLPLPSVSLPPLPLPTPSLPVTVTVTVLPSGTPTPSSTDCLISIQVPGVLGTCVL